MFYYGKDGKNGNDSFYRNHGSRGSSRIFFNKNRKNSFRCLWLLRNLVLSDMSLSFRASSYA